MKRQIEGVLFDSGDTLVRPLGGAWWPPVWFEEILGTERLRRVSANEFRLAFSRGMGYLNANHDVADEDGERRQFQAYYAIVLRELGMDPSEAGMAGVLAEAQVARLEIEAHPDAAAGLARLRRRGLRLAVVSNAWPSLERKYRALELYGYFDAFVISSRVGRCKPDERIYRAALAAIDLAPERLLFVDDVAEYVAKAVDLGMAGAVMVREGPLRDCGLPCVRGMEDIEALL